MNARAPVTENICAVIVAYHPDHEFKERVSRIASQVHRVIIVDNASGAEAAAMLSELAADERIVVLRNKENLGVATALNIGLNDAHTRGYDWALLFDQDSTPITGMLASIITAYHEHPENEKIAVIGANYVSPGKNEPHFWFPPDETQSWEFMTSVITSGSLHSLPIQKRVGFFRDRFFIDHVDDDYCLRARALGYHVIMVKKPLMAHSLGAETYHRFLWRRAGTTNHSSLRRYYMTRNHVILAREYLLREPSWVFKSFYSRFKSILLMICFEGSRGDKIKSILLGLWHGVFSKEGRYDPRGRVK